LFRQLRLKDGLGIYGDSNVVTHDKTTLIKGTVPADAKVVTVELRGCEKPCASLGSLVHSVLPPRRLPLPQVLDLEFDGPRNSANSEVPDDDSLGRPSETNLTSAKGDLGKALYVEEIRTLQMRVSISLTAPKAARVDDGLDT